MAGHSRARAREGLTVRDNVTAHNNTITSTVQQIGQPSTSPPCLFVSSSSPLSSSQTPPSPPTRRTLPSGIRLTGSRRRALLPLDAVADGRHAVSPKCGNLSSLRRLQKQERNESNNHWVSYVRLFRPSINLNDPVRVGLSVPRSESLKLTCNFDYVPSFASWDMGV